MEQIVPAGQVERWAKVSQGLERRIHQLVVAGMNIGVYDCLDLNHEKLENKLAVFKLCGKVKKYF